jgi:lysine 2,3-aminomutase
MTEHKRSTRCSGQQEKPTAVRDVDGLIAAGLAPLEDRELLQAVEQRYAVGISAAMRELIDSPDDAIGRQFVPDPAELTTAPHESIDPIADDALSPVKGIVHRYPDRVLLKPLLVCPVYCRFCFRREHVGQAGGALSRAELACAYAWIRARPTIREVILSGGDPLMLSARRLGEIVEALSAIPHVEVLRVHTRVPVADPERVTPTLIAALTTSKAMFLVLHANHAREFTDHSKAAIRRVLAAAIPVFGQSVLLRGVNDSVQELELLFRAMLGARMKPYYLHQLDPAPGTARFHVPLEEGRALLRHLRGRLSGLALPSYVLDIPGGHGKVPVGPEYLGPDDQVRDPWGRTHRLTLADRAQITAKSRA